jgi:hypothetical protein
MRGTKWIFIIVAVLAFSLYCVADGHAKAYKYMTILTGGTGGVYYPFGGGMANVLTKANISNVTAESTGASVENCNLVGRGRAEMGLAMAGACYDAYNGLGKFKERGKLPIVAMYSAYPSPMHILVLAKSDIKSVSDLKGKKVSVGAFGSGTENMAKNMLNALGITYDDFKPAYLSFAETAMGLRDGVVDAGFMAVAIPASAVLDLGSTREVRFIPLTEKEVKTVTDKFAYYSSVAIPKGSYEGIGGVAEDTLAAGVQNVLICQKEMPDELVYTVVKTLFENQKKLVEVHQIANQMTAENAVKVPIPMHPGAEKYFKEIGALK